MTATARMAVLNLRTVMPYRIQGLLLFGLVVLLFANRPTPLVPVLVLFFTSTAANYPFHVADKAGLDTLYAILPLRRRSVIHGYYVWALVAFVVTAGAGITTALLLARAESAPLDGRTVLEVLTASWVLFAVSVAVQFPLLIRFGYSRINVLGSTVPLALISLTVLRLHVTFASARSWLPLFWVAGAAAVVASVAVAATIDPHRVNR
jgi:hypothetical protein